MVGESPASVKRERGRIGERICCVGCPSLCEIGYVIWSCWTQMIGEKMFVIRYL